MRTAEVFIPKKITNLFIKKMVTNIKVKNEMSIFINDELTVNHKNETNRKIHSLAKKWQSLLSNKTFNLFDGICKVIEEDSKFKLPWTSKEVDHAIASTNKLFGIVISHTE